MGFIGFILVAKNRHITPFSQNEIKLNPQELKNNHLLLDDFLSQDRFYPGSILIGGGNSIVVFDTITNQIISFDQFVNSDTKFDIILNQISQLQNQKSIDIINASLFDFSNDPKLTKFLSKNTERGFYFGIYRELIENLVVWQKKYHSYLLSTKLIDNGAGSKEILILIKTFHKNKSEDFALVMPIAKTNQHIYDFLIKKNINYQPQITAYLSKFGYSYPEFSKIRKIWKIDSKKYELRNVKWNFD